MALDTRWKNPQGKSPEQLHDAIVQIVRELRKGEKAVANFVQFPSTQQPSSDPNALDDYEEGTWTPILTFATPGDLVVAYSVQEAQYRKIGSLVVASFQTITSSFTHSTASGDLLVSGFPFTNAGINVQGATRWSGITKAGYTEVGAFLNSAMSAAQFQAYGSGLAASIVTAADVPSGGTPGLRTTLCYLA